MPTDVGKRCFSFAKVKSVKNWYKIFLLLTLFLLFLLTLFEGILKNKGL